MRNFWLVQSCFVALAVNSMLSVAASSYKSVHDSKMTVAMSAPLVQPAALSAQAPAAVSESDNLTLEDARQYMLSLINRDRASMGLKAVVIDQIAGRAAQTHSDDMATKGYLSHYDESGANPIERYTGAGGTDYTMENVDIHTVGDYHPQAAAVTVPVDAQPTFKRSEVERLESLYFNEVAPNDGHRRNILDPAHTSVGLGLSKAHAGVRGVRITSDQEFINKYGEFQPIPNKALPGQKIGFQGHLQKGYKLFNVDVSLGTIPQPMTMAQLNVPASYGLPSNRVTTFFPPPYASPAKVAVKNTRDGEEFALEVNTSRWAPGQYYFAVWAVGEDRNHPFVVSVRTVTVADTNYTASIGGKTTTIASNQ
ncbi:MAG: CAP domain-containing protein [Candidatus Obscuribacterales bacterium]|nr:CAP domain-containing protein [Candidatus Obscuribacterales bacterium]